MKAVMPTLSRITVYPIKSLDGIELSSARVLPRGALQHDRRWAFVDEQGRLINAKRSPALHAIRARYDDDVTSVTLEHGNQQRQFRLDRPSADCGAWLSQVLNRPCQLIENGERGWPDDEDAPGPTLISEATLRAVSQWFSLPSLDEVRRRFRANLEIDHCDPFWEDRLAGGAVRVERFSFGGAVLAGRRICQRCVVPSRDPDTGESISGFANNFAKFRQESLPADSPRPQFDHFYRVAINTTLVSLQNNNTICVGDEIQRLP